MPKVGMEPQRRAALVAATVAEIGAAGSVDVTVSKIARRAGMSSALAHHYFGGKTQIIVAAMRHILRGYSAEVRRALENGTSGRRLEAIVHASFAESCFEPDTISAWLVFYVQAQKEPEAARLLKVYQDRLQSNLVHALRGRCDDPKPVAETVAALIDGVYLRAALSGDGFGAGAADQVIGCAKALIGERV